MDSNFHYTVDLNEDQNHQPFFSSLHHDHQHHHQALSNPSFSSSSPSLSYLPFLINSDQDKLHDVGYNNNTFHGFLDPHLSQPLETKKFISTDGSSSSDQVVPKEIRLKLTIRKKENHQDQFNLTTKQKIETNSVRWISSKVRPMKKRTIITTDNKKYVNKDQSLNVSNLEEDHQKNGYNGSSTCVIRICSDCNTTKTPLWRSGPRGPKSLCNACGIRQRKARRAALAAATATSDLSPPLIKKKKRSKEVYKFSSPLAPMVKKCKRMITAEDEALMEAETDDLDIQSKSATPCSSTSSKKLYFDDLAIILSKSSAYQQVFPQDEKEAAILLMALSYGMVHG